MLFLLDMMVGNTDCSPLEEETSLLSPLLPSSFVGYEWALFFLFSFFFLLFVLEFFCRRTLRKKHLVNPTKNPTSLPLIIPFQDPLFSFSSSLFNIFTGNEYKLRHPKYLLEMNMKSEEENNGCLCRQMSFLGWLMVISWNPDHFREVSTNNEDWGKVFFFFFFFLFLPLLSSPITLSFSSLAPISPLKKDHGLLQNLRQHLQTLHPLFVVPLHPQETRPPGKMGASVKRSSKDKNGKIKNASFTLLFNLPM